MGNAKRPSIKGHCAVCAGLKGRIRGQGWSERLTAPELRKFGRSRRVGRHDIPLDQRS